MKEFCVNENDAGQRVDKFVLKVTRALPTSLLYKAIRTKKIKVNRKRCEPGQILCPGDTLQLFLSPDFFSEDVENWKHLNAELAVVYEDENIIYTFHIYEPFEFTHQRGVLQAAPLFYHRDMPYPGDIDRYRDYKKVVSNDPNGYPGYQVMDKQYLQDAMQPAFDFIQAHPDKILWCGEFGTIRHANIRWRESWMRDVIALLKEHQIPYCVWNYLSTPNDGNRFSLVDDDTRKILSPALAEIIRGNV